MRISGPLAFLLAGIGICQAQSTVQRPADDLAPAAPPKQIISFDKTAIDVAVDPCSDFYQYACGNWKKQNPIPADKTRWGQFQLLHDRNSYLLYQDLKKAADQPKSALQTKYGNYFAACMNVDLANRLGAKPLAPELDAIAGLKDKKQLAAFDVKASHDFAAPYVYRLDVSQDQKDSSKQILETDQGGLSLPDRDYYLNDDDRTKQLRQKYVAHMTKMFTLLGDSPEQASAEANDVLRIETALAKGSQARVDRRDPANVYHIMSVDELQALSPDYDWKQYLAGQGFGQVKTLNVVSPNFVKAWNSLIETESISAIQHYMRWRALHRSAALLSQPFADEDFLFFSKTLNGQDQPTPRWLRCTNATDAALGEAVGQDWVKQNFPPEAKAKMDKLIDALEKALAEDIHELPWMSEPTKQQAEAKLKAMERKIGYPEKWRDYSTLTVKRDDPVGNLDRAVRFERAWNFGHYGKPVDKSEWDMTPPTVNAYYNGEQVNINFPAGILQPPFFSDKIDPAVNYGGIGVVIGHEMTHGFDDQGAQFDLKGNLNNWFTKEDLDQFHQRTACLADEYSGFQPVAGTNLNGRLTLGENTADNGGLRIAFRALEETLKSEGAAVEPGYVDGKRDGYTPEQRYFLGFAQVWCENTREESARVRAKVDPHSPGQFRVNGSVQNFPEFGKAFGCHVGQPMMPEKTCRVW